MPGPGDGDAARRGQRRLQAVGDLGLHPGVLLAPQNQRGHAVELGAARVHRELGRVAGHDRQCGAGRLERGEVARHFLVGGVAAVGLGQEFPEAVLVEVAGLDQAGQPAADARRAVAFAVVEFALAHCGDDHIECFFRNSIDFFDGFSISIVTNNEDSTSWDFNVFLIDFSF